MSDWPVRFIKLAQHISQWSKDPSTKVGAVVVDDSNKVILSTGWNGLPRGVADTHERLNNREWKYQHIVHAEMNAILNAARIGASLQGAWMYVSALPPCSTCASAIVQAGIAGVYVPLVEVPSRWKVSCDSGQAVLEEAGVRLLAVNLT